VIEPELLHFSVFVANVAEGACRASHVLWREEGGITSQSKLDVLSDLGHSPRGVHLLNRVISVRDGAVALCLDDLVEFLQESRNYFIVEAVGSHFVVFAENLDEWLLELDVGEAHALLAL